MEAMRGARVTLHAGAFAGLLVAVALAAATLAAAPAWGSPGAAVRVAAKPEQAKGKAKAKAKSVVVVSAGTGIVQAVRARAIVVRQLDGSVLRVPVSARTRVFVDGVRATLGDVRPGFVVQFSGRAGWAVRTLRAVDPSPKRTSGVATVESVSADAVVVSLGEGTGTIPVDARTRVFVDGRVASLADVRPGDVVAAGGRAASARKPVRVLRVRRPG
jgi:hypothetical protein